MSVEGPEDLDNWEQDEDVLDTWASSNLWPFATFGWPSDDSKVKAELDYFYPTSMLVTGFDIIFFWVARMIMSGLELTGEAKDSLSDEEIHARVPFKHIFIHGLIRDSQGRKMSKSLGNSPDPLDLIEKFGADGLRFGIINIAPSGSDILFSEERIEIGRNFCTKLWNACRFRQMSGELSGNDSLEGIMDRLAESSLDGYGNWILNRLLETTREIESQFERFEMHQLTHSLHRFFWGDFCDWYVEAAKAMLQSKDDPRHGVALAVSDLVIRQALQLLHPVMPFITEELWQAMGFGEEGSFLQDTRLPKAAELSEALASRGVVICEAGAQRIQEVNGLISQARGSKRSTTLLLNEM